MTKIENNLRDIRTMYGLSQEDVANAMGINSRSTVVAVEKGERDLTSEEMGRLADYLGVEMVDLITLDMPNYDKYREMIVETLRRYQAYSGHSAPKTLLAKLIYLIDFAWYYEELIPMSGMKYRRLQYGPVPDQYFRFVDELVDDNKLGLQIKSIPGRSTKSQSLSVTSEAADEPLQYLGIKEVEMIDAVTKEWKDADVDEIVSYTHTQLPWQICRPNEFIPYELITQEEPEHVYKKLPSIV